LGIHRVDELIDSIVISLSRCCLPMDEGPGLSYSLEPPLLKCATHFPKMLHIRASENVTLIYFCDIFVRYHPIFPILGRNIGYTTGNLNKNIYTALHISFLPGDATQSAVVRQRFVLTCQRPITNMIRPYI